MRDSIVFSSDLITNLTTTFVRHQVPEDAVINEYTQTVSAMWEKWDGCGVKFLWESELEWS